MPLICIDLPKGVVEPMTATVCFHAWTLTEDGEQTSAKMDSGEIVVGYCVYMRRGTPADPQQPFDISDERDFDQREEAEAEAEDRAARLGPSLHVL